MSEHTLPPENAERLRAGATLLLVPVCVYDERDLRHARCGGCVFGLWIGVLVTSALIWLVRCWPAVCGP